MPDEIKESGSKLLLVVTLFVVNFYLERRGTAALLVITVVG